MSGPGIFALVGFFLGIVLHVFLFMVVAKSRQKGRFRLVLFCLLSGLLAWYAGNFLSALLRHMNVAKVATALVCTDTLSFLGLAFLPPLMVHTHWLYFRRSWRPGPLVSILFPPLLIPMYASPVLFGSGLALLFDNPAMHPLQKLGSLTAPFLILLSTAYGVSLILQIMIIRNSTDETERRVFWQLAAQFIAIPLYTAWAFSTGVRIEGNLGEYAVTLAFLASIFPALTVAYHIYRHEFLQITVHRSLASAFLIIAVMLGYLAGIRRLVQFLEREMEAPVLLLETTFLIALLLLFPPVTGWVQRWVSRSLTQQIERYRAAGESIDKASGTIVSIAELSSLIEKYLERHFPGSEVSIELKVSPGDNNGAHRWELRSGDRLLGYLVFKSPADEEQTGFHEGMQVLSAHLATVLDRCQMMERQLNLERALAQKSHMEQLGQTAAAIAHNVKNPLSSMKTLLQLQLEAQNLSESQKNEIEMMLGEINRLSNTVTKLLRFSRLDRSPEGEEALQEVDLGGIFDTLKSVFRGDLEASGIRLTIRTHPASLAVKTNPEFLQDILANLISNAIDASQSGGEIVLTGHLDDSLAAQPSLELAVLDQGQGIPPQHLQKLSQPFFTTKATGTGIGLAIVSRRVEQLGGRFQIASPGVGQGTKVSIILPIDPTDSTAGISPEKGTECDEI